VPLDPDPLLRLVAATASGIVIGLDRDIGGKPIGMRTLALVALGSSLAPLAALNVQVVAGDPQATARVLQGALAGILTGVGFIGTGVVLRDRVSQTVHGLTTAASVWVTAALGIACALGAWPLVVAAILLTVAVLFGLGWIERRMGLKD